MNILTVLQWYEHVNIKQKAAAAAVVSVAYFKINLTVITTYYCDTQYAVRCTYCILRPLVVCRFCPISLILGIFYMHIS